MVDRKDWDLSRRELMKMGPALGAGSALGGMLPGSARAQGVTLDWWWWGEQELPGLQKVVDGAVAAYKNATVEADAAEDTAGRHLAVPDGGRRRQRARHPVSLERHLPHGERVVRLLSRASKS